MTVSQDFGIISAGTRDTNSETEQCRRHHHHPDGRYPQQAEEVGEVPHLLLHFHLDPDLPQLLGHHHLNPQDQHLLHPLQDHHHHLWELRDRRLHQAVVDRGHLLRRVLEDQGLHRLPAAVDQGRQGLELEEWAPPNLFQKVVVEIQGGLRY